MNLLDFEVEAYASTVFRGVLTGCFLVFLFTVQLCLAGDLSVVGCTLTLCIVSCCFVLLISS